MKHHINYFILLVSIVVGSLTMKADIWDNGTYVMCGSFFKGDLITFDVESSVLMSDGSSFAATGIGGIIKSNTNKVWLKLCRLPHAGYKNVSGSISVSSFDYSNCYLWLEGTVTDDGRYIKLDPNAHLYTYDYESNHGNHAFSCDRYLSYMRLNSNGKPESIDSDQPILLTIDDQTIEYVAEDNLLDGAPAYIGYIDQYHTRESFIPEDSNEEQWEDKYYYDYNILKNIKCVKQSIQPISYDIDWQDNKWMHYDEFDDDTSEFTSVVMPVSLYQKDDTCLLKIDNFIGDNQYTTVLSGKIVGNKVSFKNWANVSFSSSYYYNSYFHESYGIEGKRPKKRMAFLSVRRIGHFDFCCA